jgi:hypothetical protein
VACFFILGNDFAANFFNHNRITALSYLFALKDYRGNSLTRCEGFRPLGSGVA